MPPMRSSSPAAIPLRERACRVRRPGQHDHLVDDQLADIERRNRQQRPGQAKYAFADGQQRARLPDEPDKRRQIAQRADALSQRARFGRRSACARRGGLGCASPHRVMLGHRAVEMSGGCRRETPEAEPCYDNFAIHPDAQCRPVSAPCDARRRHQCRRQSYVESSFGRLPLRTRHGKMQSRYGFLRRTS